MNRTQEVDRDLERLPSSLSEQRLGPTCYHIAVKTGKKFSAGTDANVFIIIYGKNGRTTIHELDNPGINDFEAGKTSEFTVSTLEQYLRCTVFN